MHFGQQAGIQVSVDSRLLRDKSVLPLHGEYSGSEALQHLLSGSGLYWLEDESGLLTLKEANGAPLALDNIQISDHRSLLGETVIGRNLIESLPAGNGDITSLLKIHPNVQFDNKQQSSKTPGEISPAEISINGAKFYQNAFIVDGMNMNNDIDPAQEDTPFRLDSVPGTSQGMALDTDLLDEIKVLDSNVSAAYGRFNGGVIEATTRKPSQDFRGKVSSQMTRSSWTKYHIDDSQEESFENSSSYDEQPNFKKLTVRTTLEGHLTEDFGILADFTSKRSDITNMFYQAHNVAEMGSETADQRRRIDNYFLKGVWKANERLNLEGSVTYAPEENSYFRAGIRGAGVDIERGGAQINFKANWQADWGRIEQTLGWSEYELSRDAESDDYMSWYKSDSKPWGVGNNTLEGEFGDIEQKQSGYQYRLDTQWNPTELFGAIHKFRAGLELADQHVIYERLSESSTYVSPRATSTCTNSQGITDNLTCALGTTHHSNARYDGWDGQFLSTRTRYATGKFEFSTTSYALYLEDSIEINRLTVRPGIRLDDDSYMDKTTLAPRLAIAYDLFGNDNTRLQAGANRYYGRNIASWRLKEGRNRLRHNAETRTTLNSEWTMGNLATNQVKFNKLDIAYDDELTFGINHRWADFDFGLKYVNRKGRDQVIQVRGTTIGEPSIDPTLANSYTTWTNDGKSETDIVTLTVTPLQDFTWLGTRTNGQVALDWIDSKKSSPTYFEDGDDYWSDPIIQYDGKFIHYSERPADNYNRPWTARLTTMTEIPQWNLSWSNFFRYRAAYSKVGSTGRRADYQGQEVAVWEERDYSNAFTWDLRLSWELPTARNQALFVNADVFNVLDKTIVADSTSVNVTGIPTYEIGRQFWLEVGYRF
ncbi:TonB-dependent receptor [Stutzerimonas kirkiae]|uniref:TonB-dependent receptor n=1 Tax=Stutzerimonas kirkiae TaxID=2211392 RepID=A0A4Q9R721_9GAMM|nr:TonB-dependent receptor [Stutzerimonas kirkiae]TBV02795.1 TonB-dependent receptor [Stutzerimonas kirkiae]TBV03222.1 TonB-dependent receptor [Stutzerimonas kirkiae]TBV13310.1 TonB-dependent receptor [Stutzerimonas kirkiae]